MWLITKKGFVSVVQHRENSEIMIVRARKRDHLKEVINGLANVQIERTPNADYLFRAYLNRQEFNAVLFKLSKEIQYDNFKNAIEDHELHAAAFKIWSILHCLQSKGGSNDRIRNESEEA